MMARDDGGPAYPTFESNGEGHLYCSGVGMSLRDHFAAKAMHAMTTGSWPDQAETKEIAERAYRMADAMLEARK